MSEQIIVFRKNELPVECSNIEVVNHFGYDNKFCFEITCVHCKIKIDTPVNNVGWAYSLSKLSV